MKCFAAVMVGFLVTATQAFGQYRHTGTDTEEHQEVLKAIASDKSKSPLSREDTVVFICDAEFLVTQLNIEPDPGVRRAIVKALDLQADDSAVIGTMLQTGRTDTDYTVRDCAAGVVIRRGYEKEGLDILKDVIRHGVISERFASLKNDDLKQDAIAFLSGLIDTPEGDTKVRASSLVGLLQLITLNPVSHQDIMHAVLIISDREFVKRFVAVLASYTTASDCVIRYYEEIAAGSDKELATIASAKLASLRRKKQNRIEDRMLGK